MKIKAKLEFYNKKVEFLLKNINAVGNDLKNLMDSDSMYVELYDSKLYENYKQAIESGDKNCVEYKNFSNLRMDNVVGLIRDIDFSNNIATIEFKPLKNYKDSESNKKINSIIANYKDGEHRNDITIIARSEYGDMYSSCIIFDLKIN